MKISNIKMNGLETPMGYDCTTLTVSWVVTEAAGCRQLGGELLVSDRPDFSSLLLRKTSGLNSGGTSVQIDLCPRTRYYVRVRITDDAGDQGTGESWFETGKLKEPWTGRWITTQPGDDFRPVFRQRFSARPGQKGRIYLTGVGLYEGWLNGEKIGADVLAPFLTDYHHEIQYQSYDISPLLREENTLEIFLGDGWYKGRYGIQGQKEYFGNRLGTVAEVWLDGTLALATDESWQYQGSDIETDGIYFGEIFNRQLWKERENPLRPAALLELDTPLIDRLSPPLTIAETLPVQEILRTPAGETVLDFGQNHTGWIAFQNTLPAGCRVTFSCGEILQQGNFYHDNYRAAESTFVYVSDGKPEWVRPHFTFFGFRYLKVTGWVGELTEESMVSPVLHSALERTGYLETGSEKLNRLYENVLWGQKSNFLDIPTDCPQRDERLGWTGDAQVFAPTACYNMDTRAFYAKFLHDLRGEQQHYGKGAVPSYFPSMGDFSTSSIWGDAAALLPDTLNRFYHQEGLRKLAYPLLKDWVEYVRTQSHDFLFDTGFTFGDWLAQDGMTPQSFKGGTDDVYLSTVYACRSAQILGELAEELGLSQDAARYSQLSQSIRRKVLEVYFTPAGRLSVDTQAAYVIALKFGIYVDKNVLLEQFLRRLKYDGFQIKCGFVGAPLICTVLAENGMTGLACDLLLREEYPSWLYAVNLGATTVWERWNSLLPDGSCSGTGMNSFNHYSYGAVMEFVYGYLAGIRPAKRGFRSAVIAPEPDIRLRRLKASYASTSGTYQCQWEIQENGMLHLRVEVPFDCTATIVLPRCELPPQQVGAGSYDYHYQPTRDYRAVYGWDTRLSQLEGDEEAIAALMPATPQLAGLLRERNGEFTCQTFGELQHQFFLGLNPRNVGETVERLQQILRW